MVPVSGTIMNRKVVDVLSGGPLNYPVRPSKRASSGASLAPACTSEVSARANLAHDLVPGPAFVRRLLSGLAQHGIAPTGAMASQPRRVATTSPSRNTVMSPSTETLSTMSAVCERVVAAAVRAPSCWLPELVTMAP